MRIKLIAATKTDVGKQREQNEDNVYQRIEHLEDGDRGLFIVADGMGGYKAGEVASLLAVETISNTLDGFFRPIPEQTTIKLNLSALDLPDADATVILPNQQPVQKTEQKTRKLSDISE